MQIKSEERAISERSSLPVESRVVLDYLFISARKRWFRSFSSFSYVKPRLLGQARVRWILVQQSFSASLYRAAMLQPEIDIAPSVSFLPFFFQRGRLRLGGVTFSYTFYSCNLHTFAKPIHRFFFANWQGRIENSKVERERDLMTGVSSSLPALVR